MAILNNSNAISSGGYDINNSLRFRASASARLSRTFGTTGTNNKVQTFSAWVKRGLLSSSTTYRLMGCYDGSSANSTEINFNNDTLRIEFGGAASNSLITTQVFRDPSAWYHVVIAIDTTQATAANRIKMYVNGTQITAFGTANYPAQNAVSQLTSANANNSIGAGWSGFEYFDGYMTEINFIDGQAKAPSDFGETDTTTGSWKPKAYTGTYGTNGFYLKFSDIATTSGSNAGLGKDFSGNANYWTTNNISVTAGTTYDAMIDSPTLTSATVANYAVYDQLIPANVSGSGVRTISAANLSVTNSGPNGWSAIGTTMVMTSGSGKWYWEVTCSGTTSNGSMIGIHRPFTSTATFPSAIIGYDTPADPDGYGYYMGGNKYNNSGAGVAYGASYTAGDVIGVALDMSTAGSASITFYKNNTSQGVAFSSLTGDFFAAVSQAQANGLDINFGQRPFTYTPPTGYVRLNTYNLPDSTIKKGNTVMDATLYTGTGASLSVTNTSAFKPDLVWVKGRSGATDHALYDSVRGTTKDLVSNSTAAETTQAQGLTAFGTGGFTVGTLAKMNTSAATYVGWQWQAGQGSSTSNTNGSITSTVSVNATAGFSVVTYTGTGTTGTVGHGLGVAPKMIILKARNQADSWLVYHSGLPTPATNTIILESTGAVQTSSLNWNSTNPTSSVFSVYNPGSGGYSNGNGYTYVAYCWAEIAGFSKFGSYTGNGSTDGVFVYTGFRPKYLMIKVTNAVNEWIVVDSARATYNVIGNYLLASTSGAEDSGYQLVDFLSNGFKMRNSFGGWNGSGENIIYMAFAENPFKNANAR